MAFLLKFYNGHLWFLSFSLFIFKTSTNIPGRTCETIRLSLVMCSHVDFPFTAPFPLQVDSLVGDTRSAGGITSGCGRIVDHTRDRCQALRSKTFVLMSNYAARGLCLNDLAKQVGSAYLTIGGSQVELGMLPVQYFSFSCSFLGENWPK